MKKLITLLILLCAVVNIYSDANKELASLYTDEAFYYYNRSNFTLSDEYVQKALTFSENHPETWYLAGLLREEQGDRFKAMEMYEKSLELTEVLTDFYYDLYYRYLNLLSITKKHNDVLNFYNKNKVVFERDDEIILKAADSAYRYGFIEKSIELSSQVYKRNPYSLKAILYLMRAYDDDHYINSIEMALHKLEMDNVDEIVFQYIIMEHPGSNKDKLLEIYRDIFGETDFYHLETQGESEVVGASNNLMIRSFSDEELQNGVYFGDYNFDGVSDEILSVIGDDLTYLKDSNQDNVTDLSVNFQNHIPVDIFLNIDGEGFEFSYSSYPYIDEIRYHKNGQSRTFKIYPGTEYTPLKNIEFFDWKYNANRNFLSDDFKLSETDLLEMAFLMVEYFPESETVQREFKVIDGEIRAIREREREVDPFNYFLDVNAWLPETGRRDLDLDGTIDIYEYYDHGKINGIAIDWDNNGKPEYIEDWSVLHIKSWDFDGDSIPDAEYIHSSEGDGYYSIPWHKKKSNNTQLYSWDFSYDNFWFNNN